VSTDQPPPTGSGDPGAAPLPHDPATSGAEQAAPPSPPGSPARPHGAPAAPGAAYPQGYPAGQPGPYQPGYPAGQTGPYQQGYPPSGAAPGPHDGTGAYPGPRKYDGFAIAGFIFSLLGGLLGIVFGIIGIRRTRGGRAKGRGLAIAAVVIGSLWLLLYGIGIFLVATNGFTSSSSYTAGDCVKVSDGADDQLDSEVAPTLPTVACAEPHNGEVIAAKDLPTGAYPGLEQVQQDTEVYCRSEFESFVGLPFDDSELNMFFVYPEEQGWGLGDHQIACVVVDAEDVTGSLRDAAR
jgi:hypothetical protein